MSTSEVLPSQSGEFRTIEEPGWRARPPRRRFLVGVLAVVSLGGLLFIAARERPQATASVNTAADVPVQDGDLIRFSKAFAQRARITTEAATLQTMSPLVRASGTVGFDPRAFAAVGARITGRIRQVFKLVGDRVRKDDVLAEVESAELGRAQAQVMAARARESAAEAQVKREQRLAEAHISSARDAEAAVAAFESARAERVAAEQTVKALGGDRQSELGVLALRSPIAGRIVTAKIARGQTVQPSDTLYDVADLATVWVELEVFERDVGTLRVGDRVRITAQAARGVPLDGRVANVGDVIDRDARTAAVRVIVDNASGALRPGQSVTARIETTAPAAKVVSVPLQAVTRVDGKATVFLSVDDSTIRLREVTTGPEDATHVAILEGLRAGEKVVVGGVFAVKSELFR
jgi:cobalt-zinc-cadmium efflux system membrane fusion protein